MEFDAWLFFASPSSTSLLVNSKFLSSILRCSSSDLHRELCGDLCFFGDSYSQREFTCTIYLSERGSLTPEFLDSCIFALRLSIPERGGWVFRWPHSWRCDHSWHFFAEKRTRFQKITRTEPDIENGRRGRWRTPKTDIEDNADTEKRHRGQSGHQEITFILQTLLLSAPQIDLFLSWRLYLVKVQCKNMKCDAVYSSVGVYLPSKQQMGVELN